jgi:hypothetical protein
MKPVTIEINKAELAHIRQYLTAERRGDAYSADAGDTIYEICRRAGFAAADTVFPMAQRTPGICVVCGCTEKDPCHADSEPCAWADGEGETICSRCADA